MNRPNLILMIIITAILITALAFTGGCKDESAVAGEVSAKQEESAEQTEDVEPEEEDAEEDIQDTEQEEKENTEEAIEEDNQEEEAEEVEETEEIPEDITEEIETADNYFNEGMYGEAAKEYRDAVRVINDSDISQDLKEELLAMISQDHQDSENIIETARMHHGNAMSLQYEKRFEEAKTELEAALDIYPKYQTAIDALDSLEALMGLK